MDLDLLGHGMLADVPLLSLHHYGIYPIRLTEGQVEVDGHTAAGMAQFEGTFFY